MSDRVNDGTTEAMCILGLVAILIWLAREPKREWWRRP